METETNVYHVKVQFTFPIDATSEEAAREMAEEQLNEWLENVDTDALLEAARNAEIEQVKDNEVKN